jgi:2-C-methyl-D-erythritol 4-phosphate cytidylyltransferase
MLEWSLRAFADAGVGAAIVAAPAGEESRFRAEVDTPGSMEVSVVAGGTSRSESVAAALDPVGTELVAVHDAARPLVTPELIAELVEALLGRADAAGVIAAAPISDTVKRAREPRVAGGAERGGPTVVKTESRDHLWSAQTPQVFRTEALRKALMSSPQRVAEATDDAWLVEEDGGQVLIHPAPPENLKVTTPFDLRVAEMLLADRGVGG